MTPPPTHRELLSQLRAIRRDLRKANALLTTTESFLHNLQDHQCPTQLLDSIRRFNHDQGAKP